MNGIKLVRDKKKTKKDKKENVPLTEFYLL